MTQNESVLVAMSGGVDSAAAAYLAAERGFGCAGLTLKLHSDYASCIKEAEITAEKLGIPHYTADCRDAFLKEVIDRFVKTYIKGHTPNPCIYCNRFIKFAQLLKEARKLGYTRIATGHYANTEYDAISGRWLLKKAADLKKDQSYVLYTLTQEYLKYIIFPLGSLTKQEVKEIAQRQNLVNAQKKESQDICFIPDKNYAGFIEKYSGRTFPEGNFTDRSGNILGRHRGIIRYTQGQKRGLGISLGRPMYVYEKNAADNTVVLCGGDELYTKSLFIRGINLIPFDSFSGRIKVNAKIRYNQKEQPALAEQINGDLIHIEFEKPQRAVTAGQSAVLYDGDTVVGGGTIAEGREWAE